MYYRFHKITEQIGYDQNSLHFILFYPYLLKMLFENCGLHAGQVKEIVVQSSGRFEIVCKECWDGGVKEYGGDGVILCQDIGKYFIQWNQYLIDELRSILNNISEQGVDFLFEYPNQIQNKEIQHNILKNPFSGSVSNLTLSSIISQHIDLLTQRLTFMSQRKSLMELKDTIFLRDLFTITTKTVEHILQPIKKEFQQVLKRQFNQECQIEWSQEVINVIGMKRQQILHDCARNCLLKKAVSATLISKPQSQENQKVETQHSINQSRSSCVSLSFDEQIEKFDLSQCGDHEIIDRTQSYVIDTKKENQMLLRLLKTKDEEIQILNEKLASSEKSCREWMEKYEMLQKTHQKLVQERIPAIQHEFDRFESTICAFIEENEQFSRKIQQLNEELLSLDQENLKLKSRISNHYVNPLYEKQKNEEKFLTQLIQLQSQNILKKDDLTMIIGFLRSTKNKIQSMTTTQNWNDFKKNWEKQMMEKVNSLQSITIKQL